MEITLFCPLHRAAISTDASQPIGAAALLDFIIEHRDCDIIDCSDDGEALDRLIAEVVKNVAATEAGTAG